LQLPRDALGIDLVAALDYASRPVSTLHSWDLVCDRGSAKSFEQRIAAAKQQGVGIIAAAG